MRNLLIAVFLLVLIGIAGFLYRNSVENRDLGPGPGACTLEAKICPDGTAVGRTGPGCSFAACPAGNVEDADNGVSYALPAGYAADENAYGPEPTLIGAYEKPVSGSFHSIIVRAYPIPDGQTAQQTMLENTLLQPSDMRPKDAGAFTPKVIGTHTFSSIVVERFEGHINSAYFLPRGDDVLRFDIVERGVENWTNPNLAVDSLPEHQAFLKMLNTLQVR